MTTTTTPAGWKQFYGLSRTPFTKTITASEIFRHDSHREAAARIRHAIEETAIAMITGEVGVGKTVAARAAIAALEPSSHTIVYIANTDIGARGIHQQIVHTLGVAPRFHRGALIHQTADLLARERDERDKTVVLIVDEAHLLDPDQLEQLRMLSNDRMDSDSLVAIILLGQPTLARRVRRGSFTALDQRITVRYQIQPLTGDQTSDYINHRMKQAGRSDPLFADDATAAIAYAARGLPREIGNLATAALIAGHTRRNTIIDHTCATAAIADHTDIGT